MNCHVPWLSFVLLLASTVNAVNENPKRFPSECRKITCENGRPFLLDLNDQDEVSWTNPIKTANKTAFNCTLIVQRNRSVGLQSYPNGTVIKTSYYKQIKLTTIDMQLNQPKKTGVCDTDNLLVSGFANGFGGTIVPENICGSETVDSVKVGSTDYPTYFHRK